MRLRSEGVASRRVGGDVMVLDLATSQYFAIGGVGTTILEILGERDATEDEIVAEILARYAVEESRARADVRAFAERLRAAHLLEGGGGAAPGGAAGAGPAGA